MRVGFVIGGIPSLGHSGSTLASASLYPAPASEPSASKKSP